MSVEWCYDGIPSYDPLTHTFIYQKVDVESECVKYAGNLLLKDIIKPEISFVSKELCDMFDFEAMDAIDAFYALQKDSPCQKRKLFDWLLHDDDLNKNINAEDISRHIDHFDRSIVHLAICQEFEKYLVCYNYYLRTWQKDLIDVITGNDSTYTHYDILISSLRTCFFTNQDYCFERFQMIDERLDMIARHVKKIEKKFQKFL